MFGCITNISWETQHWQKSLLVYSWVPNTHLLKSSQGHWGLPGPLTSSSYEISWGVRKMAWTPTVINICISWETRTQWWTYIGQGGQYPTCKIGKDIDSNGVCINVLEINYLGLITYIFSMLDSARNEYFVLHLQFGCPLLLLLVGGMLLLLKSQLQWWLSCCVKCGG